MRARNILGLFRQTDDDRRRELLSSYIDGELTDDEVREVEELLGSSDDARQELSGLKMSVALIGQLPELALPRSFKLDTLPEEQKTPWWSSLWATGLVTSMATMLLVALVAGDMLNVLTQTQAAAIESLDSTAPQQAAGSAAFANGLSSEAALAPPPATQAAAFDESDGSTETANEPAAAAPSLAAIASASAEEASPQPETSADSQMLAGPQAQTLAAPSIERTTAPQDSQDAPVAASLAPAPAEAPGIASIAAESTDAPTPEDTTADGSANAIEEPIVSASAPAQARALPPPAAKTSASVENQVLPTIDGEGSDAGALAMESAPVPDDGDKAGPASRTSAAAPMPATASIETQSVVPTPLDENIDADDGIELPLRQLEIGAAIIVVLFATGSFFVTRRRRTSIV